MTMVRQSALFVPQLYPAFSIPDEGSYRFLESHQMEEEGRLTKADQMFAVRTVRAEFIDSKQPINHKEIAFPSQVLLNLRYYYGLNSGSTDSLDLGAIQGVIRYYADCAPVSVDRKVFTNDQTRRLEMILKLERANGETEQPTTFVQTKGYRVLIRTFLMGSDAYQKESTLRKQKIAENLARIFENYFFMRNYTPQIDNDRLETCLISLVHPEKMETGQIPALRQLFMSFVDYCAGYGPFREKTT